MPEPFCNTGCHGPGADDLKARIWCPGKPIKNLPDAHRDTRAIEKEIAYPKTTSCFKPLLWKYGGNEEAIQSVTISGGQGFEIKSEHKKLLVEFRIA
ncbi:hypothetical protein NC651_031361 [Populus alba x Populus x berolinensis]|nr:hypothetical protein NC651_031358 [Populus alba x Populus x berolinensis]KAJ6872231.1 hypothetical protein NC651_031361 [Populus alba x Populus x berolinensis]